jgi:4-hydroxy-4-methyl-2-oxoglutarate aldolase
MSTRDIISNFERIHPDILKAASQFPSSILADVAGRRGGMHGRIAPLNNSMRIAGPAFTVEVRPGDNLMIHAAMSLAKPGDVLVIDAQANLNCALMGSIMLTACKQLNLGGVLIDGAVRDTQEVLELGIAVFAVGNNPNGPTKVASGRIGHPITCGDVTVHPGDFICGDADGITVVERNKIASLLPLAAKKVIDEAERIRQIKSGNVAANWLYASLVSAGVLKEGDTL